MKPEEFDKQFLAWLDTQVKDTVDKFPEWRKRMKELNAATIDQESRRSNQARAGSHCRCIRDFVEHGSAYELLADAYYG